MRSVSPPTDIGEACRLQKSFLPKYQRCSSGAPPMATPRSPFPRIGPSTTVPLGTCWGGLVRTNVCRAAIFGPGDGSALQASAGRRTHDMRMRMADTGLSQQCRSFRAGILPERAAEHCGTSEAESETKPEVSFIRKPAGSADAGDLGKAAQTLHCSVRVQLHIGDVRAGSGEVRRVGQVEGLSAQLQFVAFRDSKFAEQAQVEVCHPGSPHGIEPGGPESGGGDGGEGQRIEVGRAADATQNGYIR